MQNEEDHAEIVKVMCQRWNVVGKKIVSQLDFTNGISEFQRELLGFLLNFTSLKFEFGQIERVDKESGLLEQLSTCLSALLWQESQKGLDMAVSGIIEVLLHLAYQSDALLHKAVH